MLNKKSIVSILFFMIITFIFTSCFQPGQIDTIPTTQVYRDNYVDFITVSGEFESSNPQSINCPSLRQNVTIYFIVEDGSFVKKGDTLVILESPEILNDYNEALKNLETSKSEYNKTKAGLQLEYLVLQAEVESIETSTKINMLDSVQLKFSTPVRRKIIELQLEQSRIRKEQIQKKLESLSTINRSTLRQMSMKIKQQENRLSRSKETLEKLYIISSADGIALRANSWITGDKVKEGDVVWNRFPLLQIPDLSKMEIKLALNETHFKRVKKNQKVIIKADALPGVVMKGKIKYKEPVGKPIKRDSKIKVFSATVSIDTIIGNLTPGITASCDVILNEINDTLIIPYISVFDDDSIKVVYVKNKKYFEKRKVELAIFNNNTGVIKSGIKENEIVSLIKPPEIYIQNSIPNEKNSISVTDSNLVLLQP